MLIKKECTLPHEFIFVFIWYFQWVRKKYKKGGCPRRGGVVYDIKRLKGGTLESRITGGPKLEGRSLI